jgi:hypothetical protein
MARGLPSRERAGAAVTGLLALTLTVAACSNRVPPGPVTAAEPSEVALQVENQASASLTIYLDAGGISRRLGEIHTQEVLSFVVPFHQVNPGGTFRLRAEVIGSAARVVTDPLVVQPGQVVRWTLAPRLSMSSVAVY